MFRVHRHFVHKWNIKGRIIMKFHHVGIACKDIASVKADIEKNHVVVKSSEVVFDEHQDANLCLLTLQEGVNLELVSGLAVSS